jgi:hypothetical protein
MEAEQLEEKSTLVKFLKVLREAKIGKWNGIDRMAFCLCTTTVPGEEVSISTNYCSYRSECKDVDGMAITTVYKMTPTSEEKILGKVVYDYESGEEEIFLSKGC